MADLRASGLGGVPKGATADRPASPSIDHLLLHLVQVHIQQLDHLVH